MATEQRFARQIIKRDDSCWLWTGYRDRKGLGRLWTRDEMCYAHRWAYEHWRAPIPSRKRLRRACPTPNCVNPWHWEVVIVDLLTVKQAADYLRVSEASLRMAIHERRLPCLRENKRVYLRRDALNMYRSRLDDRTTQRDRCARAVAEGAVSGLDARTAGFITLYAGDMTLEQIADVAGLTRERVRQIIEEGLRQVG